MKYRKQVITLIIVSTLLRLLAAAGTELSNDEVYYWTYAHKLQWNYFDHPAGIAVLLRIFTGNLIFQQEIFLRLGSIICAAINTWQIYIIGKKIKDELTGWIAACLFTASIYASILAGMMILPDAPQMVFWLGAVLVMLNLFQKSSERRKNRQLLLVGLLIGLCIMCKVHGVFLWGGLFLFMILYERKMFRNPWFYIAILLTALVILPVLLWNLNNNFITYTYHSSRVSFWNSKIQFDSFIRQIAGEFLYNNPVNVVLIVISLLALRKMRLTNELYQQRLLMLLSIPMIAVVWLLSLFKDTLPHWTGPAYTTLIPLAAVYTRNAISAKHKIPGIPAVVKASLALPVLLLAVLLFSVKSLPFQLGNKDELKLGAGDLLLDMSGWEKFSMQFQDLYKEDTSKGLIKKDVTIITDYWFPAAHLEYYVAKPAQINFLAIGSLNNIHQYAWLNTYRRPLMTGQDAYYIAVSNYFDAPSPALINSFEKMDPSVIIPQYRHNIKVRNFYVYRLRGYKGGIPTNGVLD